MAFNKKITEEVFQEISSHFYELGSADKALSVMRYLFGDASFDHMLANGKNGPVPYFFYRVAQIYPQLWEKYGKLFERTSHNKRVFILWVFALEKSEQTDQHLESWRKNRKYEKEHGEIDAALKAADKGRNILEIERVSTASDLDNLWTEFIVTGKQTAIRRIIDVLEWSDLVRSNLEKVLEQIPDDPLSDQHSSDELRLQLLNQGIVLDNDCRSIYSAQDLDCFCILDGCNTDPNRLETIQAVLPFELSSNDLIYMGVKGSAKWSLCSNAQQHELVLDTCIKEAKKRTGRCRLSLLEIISRAYLAIDGLEKGLNYYIESLTLDPTAKNEQNKKAEEAYRQLLALKIDADIQAAGMVLDHELSITKCLETCESLRTYRAKMIWREQGTDSGHDDTVFWEIEYVQPDRFRVTQTAGDDFDEWITLSGLHYRGPMYAQSSDQTVFESDLMFNQALLIDNYLNIMREAHVDEISTHCSELGDYLILDYFHVDVNKVKLFQEREGELNMPLMRLWIKKTTNYLVKAEMVMSMESGKESFEKLHIYHLFAGHNDDIQIIPPPFAVIKHEETESKKQKSVKIPVKRNYVYAFFQFYIVLMLTVAVLRYCGIM